jgi:hypothetical protein
MIVEITLNVHPTNAIVAARGQQELDQIVEKLSREFPNVDFKSTWSHEPVDTKPPQVDLEGLWERIDEELDQMIEKLSREFPGVTFTPMTWDSLNPDAMH